MPTESETLAHRFHEIVVQKGDVQVVDELFLETCIVTDNNWTLRGSRAVKDFIAELRFAFPDLSLAVDHVEGTTPGGAVSRWHADGTHLGEFRGIAPTSIPVSFWGITHFMVTDGQIREAWTASTLPEAVEVLRAAATAADPYS